MASFPHREAGYALFTWFRALFRANATLPGVHGDQLSPSGAGLKSGIPSSHLACMRRAVLECVLLVIPLYVKVSHGVCR